MAIRMDCLRSEDSLIWFIVLLRIWTREFLVLFDRVFDGELVLIEAIWAYELTIFGGFEFEGFVFEDMVVVGTDMSIGFLFLASTA